MEVHDIVQEAEIKIIPKKKKCKKAKWLSDRNGMDLTEVEESNKSLQEN